MRFKDRIVWITGASSGIGEELAYQFSKEGAKLILSSNEESELNRVKSNCGHAKEDIFILPLNLSETNTLEAKAGDVLRRYGHIDILINNGGIGQRSLVKDTGIEIDRKIMDVDYFGHIAITKAVLPSMLERKSGHIVIISSIMGKISTPLRSAYCASKHALHGFFDSLRSEVWRDNIKVTIICPGGVKTNFSIDALTGDGSKYGKMDGFQKKGISPRLCAQEAIKAITKGKQEIVIGRVYTRLAVYIKRFAPGLYSKIVRKINVT